jgi:membrane associated rhomboid family serine protease
MIAAFGPDGGVARDHARPFIARRMAPRVVMVDNAWRCRQDVELCILLRELPVPITLIIIAVTSVVSFMAFKNSRLLNDLLLWPPAITRQREYHRLVTYGLVHADFGHLLFNMITLFFFGRVMESFFSVRLGVFGFALFYIGGLVVSILPTYLKNRGNPQYRSLGASGAVSAVLFAFILLAPWQMIIVLVVPLPAIVYAVAYTAYSIYMDRRGGGYVNHSAHLWGAAYGVLVTLLVDPRVLPHFLNALQHPTF